MLPVSRRSLSETVAGARIHLLRDASRGAGSVAAISLLEPWIAVVVMAVAFPESRLVNERERQPAHLLGALPEIQVGHPQTRRTPMLGFEPLPVARCLPSPTRPDRCRPAYPRRAIACELGRDEPVRGARTAMHAAEVDRRRLLGRDGDGSGFLARVDRHEVIGVVGAAVRALVVDRGGVVHGALLLLDLRWVRSMSWQDL